MLGFPTPTQIINRLNITFATVTLTHTYLLITDYEVDSKRITACSHIIWGNVIIMLYVKALNMSESITTDLILHNVSFWAAELQLYSCKCSHVRFPSFSIFSSIHGETTFLVLYFSIGHYTSLA